MKKIYIHEVGMRDGLQSEKITVPFEKKIEWIDKLIESNIDIIQLGSFVHPVKVPQMSDTDLLFKYYNAKNISTKFSGLALNEAGYLRALNCGCKMICFGVSASETHSQKNTGKSVNESLESIAKSAKLALSQGMKIQASIQSAFGCGFEGYINENKVIEMSIYYADNGITNISLADTAGHAYPEQVKRIIAKIKSLLPNIDIAVHFHNTYGMGIANCFTAISEGAQYLETAFGGLGGCPFTKVAAGNVCTEDLVHSLNRSEAKTNIDINPIIDVTKSATKYFEKEFQGLVYKTGIISY